MQGVTQKLLSYNDEIGENKRLYKVNVKAVRDEGVVREIEQKRLNKKQSRERETERGGDKDAEEERETGKEMEKEREKDRENRERD